MKEKIPYNLIVGYLNHELDREEEKQFRNWLQESKENQELFNEYTLVHETMGSGEIPEFDEDKALKNVHGDINFIQRPAYKISPMNLAWVFAAASVVLIIGFYYFFNQKLQTSDSNWMLVTSDNTVKKIELPDGTNVWLNKNSEISYPEQFSDTIRKITMKGEAFFEVKRDVNKPFVIYADRAVTWVLGTSFNIRARSHEKEVVVTVSEGKVMVIDSAIAKNNVILEKGESGILRKEKGEIMEMKNPDENYLSWKSGVLRFNDTPLNEVVEKISRHYQVPLVIGDSSLNKEKFTSEFQNLTFEEAGKILAWGLNAKIDTVNDKLVLKKNEK